MSVKFVFTQHAIERYIERHAPHLDLETAHDLLVIGSQEAVKLKARTVLGHTQWKIGHAMVVTKRDDGSDEEVAVTILPARVGPRQGVPDEELAMALEIVEERGAIVIEPALTLPVPAIPEKRVPPEHNVPAKVIKLDCERAKQAKTPLANTTLHHIALVEKAVETMRSKTLRHIVGSQREHAKTKLALRLAIRGLRDIDTDEARAVMDQIAALDPGLVSNPFLDLVSRRELEAAE